MHIAWIMRRMGLHVLRCERQCKWQVYGAETKILFMKYVAYYLAIRYWFICEIGWDYQEIEWISKPKG
jgi:hypothetical protein